MPLVQELSFHPKLFITKAKIKHILMAANNKCGFQLSIFKISLIATLMNNLLNLHISVNKFLYLHIFNILMYCHSRTAEPGRLPEEDNRERNHLCFGNFAIIPNPCFTIITLSDILHLI